MKVFTKILCLLIVLVSVTAHVDKDERKKVLDNALMVCRYFGILVYEFGQ